MAKTSSGGNGGEGVDPPVDARQARRRQDAIGNELRRMYDNVVREDIPDEFLAFLKQADGRDAEKAADEDASAAPPQNADKPGA